MPSTPSGITLFQAEKPDTFLLSQIYVPGVTPNLTTIPPTGNVIPVVGCILVDTINNNTLYIVQSVDPTTYATTYVPAHMDVTNTDPNEALTSIISYGNDIFRIYYDTRTNPATVRPDSRLVFFGTDNVSYQIVENPGNSQTVLSLNYDASGTYIGPLVPLANAPTLLSNGGITTTPDTMTCMPCYISQPLVDGQELFIQVFNSQGAQVAQVSAFAKQSIIVNELGYVIPTIADVSIISTQSRPNNEIYIFQNQDVASLGLQVQLTYTDGTTQVAAIDNSKCFIYGTSDFIASYPGLQQTILVKYFLSQDETATTTLLTQDQSFVSAEASLVVVSNKLSYGVKISALPRWNSATNRYDLNFFLYTTERTSMYNVTGLVTISATTPYAGSLYGVAQSLILELDMMRVDPTTYSSSTLYQQNLIITLQPISQLVRYVLADSSNATVVYGADSSNNRRPQLIFDTTTNMYGVSTIFANQAAFLQSFYTDANPLYDTTTETQPPTPTHFQIRDPASGAAITAAPIPLANYNAEFNVTGTGAANRYAGIGSSLVVEFLNVVNSTTTLILYGSVVDVYPT